MSVIERAPWTIYVCPTCNRVKKEMGCTGAHEDAHRYARTVRVDVVPEEQLQGAVDRETTLKTALQIIAENTGNLHAITTLKRVYGDE